MDSGFHVRGFRIPRPWIPDSTSVDSGFHGPKDIQDLLEKQDKKICTKVMGLEGHPLYNMLPEVKNT